MEKELMFGVRLWLHFWAVLVTWFFLGAGTFLLMYMGDVLHQSLFEGPIKLPLTLNFFWLFELSEISNVMTPVAITSFTCFMLVMTNTGTSGRSKPAWLDWQCEGAEDRGNRWEFFFTVALLALLIIGLLTIATIWNAPNPASAGLALTAVTAGYVYCLYIWASKAYFGKDPKNADRYARYLPAPKEDKS